MNLAVKHAASALLQFIDPECPFFLAASQAMGPRPSGAGAATGTAQVRGVPQYKYAPGVRNPQQHMPTQPQVPMQQVLVLHFNYVAESGYNAG